MSTTPDTSPRTVPCPSPPAGCGAAAGQPCTSHGGTRVRHTFHQARTAVAEAARIAAVPAAKLIFDAAKERRGMHGRHAAELLDEHGYTTEAAQIRDMVTAMKGHLSANQAALWLIERAEGGEAR
jgi:hypothetical protein